MLVKVGFKNVASLSLMNLLALKKIFEPEAMTHAEEALLEQSIAAWPKKVNLTAKEKANVRFIVEQLISNEKGGYIQEKEMLKKSGLSYMQLYGGEL